MGPSYFVTAGVPILDGRAFDDRETADHPRSVVVSQSLARHLWPGEEPVGKTLEILDLRRDISQADLGARLRQAILPTAGDYEAVDGAVWEVVGVAGDVRMHSLEAPGDPVLYLDTHQYPRAWAGLEPPRLHVLLRTTARPADIAEAARSVMLDLYPGLTFAEVVPMAEVVAQSIGGRGSTKLLAVVSGAFGAMALGFAALGLYGLVAHGVSRRLREIGVRVALGATRRDVVRLVVAMDVTGTVVDADGVLPGARVVLRNTEGQEYSRWTEANGRFRFGDVAAGRYVLVASLSGFRTITSDVEVVPGRVTDRRITLPVGDVFENVTVVCGGSLPQAALSPVLFDVRRGAGLPGASRLARVSTTRSMNPPLLLQSAGSPQLPVRVGGHVVPPTKLGRVNPVHPLCRQPDVSPTATVLLEARISADGRVEDIRDVTPADAAAPAALVNASVDAVRQWTYTPVMLNGRPTAADLRVTIRFVDERR